MSSTGFDANTPPVEPPTREAGGSTGPAPARRRHRRPDAKHTAGRGEAAATTTAAPTTSAERTAQSPTPQVAPVSPAPMRGRSAPRVATRVASPATASAATPSPATQPASPATAEYGAASDGAASGQERAAGARRTPPRRPSRARAPKLVPQSRSGADEVTVTPSSPPASAEAEPMTAPDAAGGVPFAASLHTLVAPSVEPIPAAPSPTQIAATAVDAPQTLGAPPVRRYRFDRPARVAPTHPVRPERLSAPASAGPVVSAPPAVAPLAPAAPAPTPGPAPRRVPVTTAEAQAVVEAAAPLPAPTAMGDELALAPSSDQTTAQPVAPVPADATALPREEAAVDAPESASPTGGEASAPAATESEDGAGTHRRRRRRRGNGNGTGIRHLEAIVPTEPVESEPPTPIAARSASRTGNRAGRTDPLAPPPAARPDDYEDHRPLGTTYAGYGTAGTTPPPYELYAPEQPEPWNVASAYQQIGQAQSPFGAPEPNIPRGFGPQPQGVAGPVHERTARTGRTTDSPPMSVNQLSSVLSQAIQQQTDRLLAEMRHTQAPPMMTLAIPALPSTERVGVFVDVANLLYAARSMRLSLDFGHLLEFLRGNRRLVRAQAYAPTSPEPNAEQQFLAVVKGVGYRITTKHYKTFSSGAKKADLDLDMCMDIVRLVDAKAVDTIALVSGDSDFLPLLEYCSDHGVRVEVAAFDDSAAAILRQSCDLFINLSLVPEIRA